MKNPGSFGVKYHWNPTQNCTDPSHWTGKSCTRTEQIEAIIENLKSSGCSSSGIQNMRLTDSLSMVSGKSLRKVVSNAPNRFHYTTRSEISCQRGCVCPEGFAKNENGKCVEQSLCTCPEGNMSISFDIFEKITKNRKFFGQSHCAIWKNEKVLDNKLKKHKYAYWKPWSSWFDKIRNRFFNIFHIRLLKTFSGYHHAEHTGCVNSDECLDENGTSHDCSETQNCVDNIGEF